MGYFDYQRRMKAKRKPLDELDDKHYDEWNLRLLEPVLLTPEGVINHNAVSSYISVNGKVSQNRLAIATLFERVWERRIGERKSNERWTRLQKYTHRHNNK